MADDKWDQWELQLLQTHSLPEADAIIEHERWNATLRALGWWMLTAAACAGAVWLLLAVSGR